MINSCRSKVTKKLLVRHILNDIDYRKRCQYLQEIIAMGRKDHLWIRALNAYFDSPMDELSVNKFCKN